MKIAFDAKRAFANRTGLGNYSRDVIRNLSLNRALELYLFTPVGHTSLMDASPYRVIVPQSPMDKAFRAYWRSFSQAKEVINLGIDLYHGLSNEIPWGLGNSCKKVVTIHDLIFKRYPQWYPLFDRKMYDWKCKRACLEADTIIAISAQTKADITHFYHVNPDKIEVVYQTCNDIFKTDCSATFKQAVRKRYHLPQRFILNVGTIEPRKNAFEVVKAVHEYGIETPLVIVGRATPYTARITEYVKQHRLEKRVFLWHHVSTKELAAFYQMASLFIYPSTFEGFGIPIIEALYSGVPVITTQGGCFSEPGGAASLYLEEITSKHIAEAINLILSNDTVAQEMIDKGRQHVQKFNAEVLTEQLISVYTQTLAQ
ncbi:MAG: hypothetical protein CSA95_00180 [Bacteroidetes bacterium]|nr:MAG: hypothetical protein CSA95_00180 [Bacteroidota bacterium]PIE88738.1 MAG: hypothetical protein CSA04_00350 [Bacteroidota bacterium]